MITQQYTFLIGCNADGCTASITRVAISEDTARASAAKGPFPWSTALLDGKVLDFCPSDTVKRTAHASNPGG